VDIPSSVEDYAREKVEKLDRYLRKIAKVGSCSSTETPRSFSAEMRLHAEVRGARVVAHVSNEDARAAVDLLMDKMERQLVRLKERRQSRHHKDKKGHSAQPSRRDGRSRRYRRAPRCGTPGDASRGRRRGLELTTTSSMASSDSDRSCTPEASLGSKWRGHAECGIWAPRMTRVRRPRPRVERMARDEEPDGPVRATSELDWRGAALERTSPESRAGASVARGDLGGQRIGRGRTGRSALSSGPGAGREVEGRRRSVQR